MMTSAARSCAFLQEGSVSYVDDYGVIYDVTVTKIADNTYDIITATRSPGIWGEEAAGSIIDRVLFRRGIITIHRQVIKTTADGYMVLSEGIEQDVGLVKSSFVCEAKPADKFCYHLDSSISDAEDYQVTCGPRWTDPDNAEDSDVTWPDVDAYGNTIPLTIQSFQFVDVWGNNDDLVGTCS